MVNSSFNSTMVLKDSKTYVFVLEDLGLSCEDDTENIHVDVDSDIQLFAHHHDACAVMVSLQQEYCKAGYRLTDSGSNEDPSMGLLWTRVEDDGGYAHVLKVFRKLVKSDLSKVHRG